MTVSSSTSRNDYDGVGTTGPFQVTFRFLENAHLRVLRTVIATNVTTTLILDSLGADGFSVTGAGQPNGGAITPITAIAVGERISILRNVPITQLTDYIPNDPFPAESHERALDKLTMIVGQQAEITNRAIVLSPQTVGVSTELPGPVALNLLRWKADLSGLENAVPPAIATVADGAVVDATVSPIAAIQGTKIQFLQLGGGAIPRNFQDKGRESFSVKDDGAVGDGSAFDGAAVLSAIADKSALGGQVLFPSGAYRVDYVSGDAVINIDASYTLEPGALAATRTGTELRGQGARASVLVNATPTKYAVKLTGGLPVTAEPHSYETHGDMSIVAGASGANGLWVLNKAFLNLENMTLQGHDTALLLESVLASRFSNLTIGNNAVYGAHIKKGSGFSGINANTWDTCHFRSNVVLGLHSELFSTAHVFLNCTFENNGRFGQPSEGGCELNFDGSEGRVGAVFEGCYFESNSGGADLFLNNTGSDYITVVLNGVTFNRNVAATYVTNCIKTTGKIKLVLNGCAFASYNGYTPNAGRKYIAGDAALIVEDNGSFYQDALEKPVYYSIQERLPFSGSVASAGTALKLPSGWSCSKLGTGSYRVTHNLAFASVNDYAVSATTSNGGTTFVLAVAKGASVFDVSTVNPSFSSTDAQFDFTMTRIGLQP